MHATVGFLAICIMELEIRTAPVFKPRRFEQNRVD